MSRSSSSLVRSKLMSALLFVARRGMRGALDPGADARIGPAATDVSRHGIVDSAVGRVGFGGEQRRSGHDLTGLAIAALGHLELDPGSLNLLARIRGADGLDRSDALAGYGGDRPDARSHRL